MAKSGQKTLILPTDPRLTWEGAISLEHRADYSRAWRLPLEEESLFFPSLWNKAGMPAGVRLVFSTDSNWVAGEVFEDPVERQIDLCINGVFVASQPLGGRSRFCFSDLPAGEKLVELWLPQHATFVLRHLEVEEGAEITRWHDTRPRWLTYGSSLTHCAEAVSPVKTWPAIVARDRSWNLTCLGFAGQCHLDLLVARLIRDLPADFISICAGINIYNQASLSVRSFVSTLIGWVRIIREKHPETPILLVSPIYSEERESKPNRVDWTLADYRSAVEEAAQRLISHGDRWIAYQDGLELFGPAHTALMPDGLHPNTEGYATFGGNFLAKAVPKLTALSGGHAVGINSMEGFG